MWLIVLSLVSTALAAPTHPPHPGTTQDPKALFAAAFKQVDTDGNGHIDVSEFYKIFDSYDTNKDGKMSIDEYIQNTHVDKTFAHEVYKFIDTDHDGDLPRGDLPQIFKLYDTNNNGVISSHEFVNEYMKIYAEIVKDLGFVPTGNTIPNA